MITFRRIAACAFGLLLFYGVGLQANALISIKPAGQSHRFVGWITVGAWGYGTFDNDDASDWVYEFESHGLVALAAILAQVSNFADNEYLEAPESAQALAAAEIVAAARDGDLSRLSENARNALAQHGLRSTSLPLENARRAVERILRQSELKEQWKATKEGVLWLEQVNLLLSRLR